MLASRFARQCVWGIMSGHDLSNDVDGSLEGFKATACYINAGHSPCGDPNGWASRQAYWNAANSCLGITEPSNEAATLPNGMEPGANLRGASNSPKKETQQDSKALGVLSKLTAKVLAVF